MRYKALATDVDGTLTSRDQGISLLAIRTIRELEERGVPVILASARPYPILNILREYIGCSGAIVCENGGHVEYGGEERVIGDRGDGLRFHERLRQLHGERVEEAWTNAYNVVDVALARSIPSEDVRTALIDYPSLKLLDSGFYYHVMPADVDKGRGLRAAAEMMGLEVEEIVAIGDSEVDIELLEVAGYGVAVADASEDLKKVADRVTEKPDGEGFHEAVRELF
ncbi:MAG TPA: phosphoglycolate phosphatase [Patescibacteria group bacterium]|nr:phosphoglycolate phosphatase [Patescibacteria group bacterium]